MRLSYRIEMVAERLLCEPIQDGAGTAWERSVIRRADESDLEELGRLVNDRRLRLFGKRLAEGKSCYVALDGKRVAYFGWLVFDEELEPNSGINVVLGENEAYWFDCYTAPEFRKQGLNTAVTTEVLKRLRDKGYQRVRLLVSHGNLASRRAFANLGFRATHRVTCIRLFGLWFHFWRLSKGELGPAGHNP